MGYLDVYELVDKSIIAGQEALNVYFYRNNNLASALATSNDLADSYIGQVLPAVTLCQTDNVLHTEISVRNLFAPSDRVTVAISEPGQNVTADTLPNANAVGFTLVQDNGAVRNGAKRYTGVREDAVTDGVIDLAGYITSLLALGVELYELLEFGVLPTWLPIVVKRILDGGEYRLPENSGELVYGNIIDAVFSPVVTTQTSRKIGVGA